MYKISVIVPVYKVEKFLSKCLDSIINQTLKEIEIIIVDEGDRDECRTIIDDYEKSDKRIKTIHEKNGSYGLAVNKAIDIASAKYISIIESDDYADLNMLEDLYRLAEDNNCDIVKSDWYNYYGNSDINIKCNNVSSSRGVTNASENKDLLKLQASIWSAIYKRDFLNKNNIRFLSTPGGSYQDTSFGIKAFMCAERVLLTNKAYIHYRQDNPKSSIKSTGKVFSICDEFNEIENFIKSREDLELYLEYIYAIQYRAYFYNMLRISENYVQEFLDVYSSKFKALYEQGHLGAYFFKRNKKNELLCLINNKEKFLKIYKRKLISNKLRDFRKKIISVKINYSGISIVFLGRQIIGGKQCRLL